MKFVSFNVSKYRNIHDSGNIDINAVTAFVGQNESGKSNLFDALYRVNPFISDDTYIIDEDWPVDDWGNKEKGHPVCEAHFVLTPEEISDLYEYAKLEDLTSEEDSDEDVDEDEDDEEDDEDVDEDGDDVDEESVLNESVLPQQLTLIGVGYYESHPEFKIDGEISGLLDKDKVDEWGKQNAPKFVYIHDYDLSGARVELDQLKSRIDNTDWNRCLST